MVVVLPLVYDDGNFFSFRPKPDDKTLLDMI